MNYRNYLQAVSEVRRAVQYPSRVTAEKLQEWISIAQTTSDFWFRTQIAQIIGELHPGEDAWGSIVLGWLVDAARRRSFWTDELLITALRGWCQLTLESTMVLVVIEHHPLAAASGLLQAIKRRALTVESIPPEWLDALRQSLERLSEGPHRQIVSMLKSELKHVPGNPKMTAAA